MVFGTEATYLACAYTVHYTVVWNWGSQKLKVLHSGSLITDETDSELGRFSACLRHGTSTVANAVNYRTFIALSVLLCLQQVA